MKLIDKKSGRVIAQISGTSVDEARKSLMSLLDHMDDKGRKTFENIDPVLKFSPDEYKQLIEKHIYAHYPQSKQASDVADKNYYETMLKAKGVKNLEADIVSRAKRFFEGESLENVVADVADADKEAYVQLLKVAIRVEWVQQCKAELKAAMKEEREPNFPDYPL